jgi:hypothetical protein
MTAREILMVPEEKHPRYFLEKIYPYFKEGTTHKERWALSIANYIMEMAFKLAFDEIVNNGQELCLFDKEKRPYFIIFIKDFKNLRLKAIMNVVKTHRYIYKARYRGHFYFFFCYTYPWFREKIHQKRAENMAQYFLYRRLKELVQKGMDYPEMPNVRVYDLMRAPYIDCKDG